MSTVSAWHESHLMAGYVHPHCGRCRREAPITEADRQAMHFHKACPVPRCSYNPERWNDWDDWSDGLDQIVRSEDTPEWIVAAAIDLRDWVRDGGES